MKVFFKPEMAADSNGFSPSARKPEQVVADWQSHSLPIEIHDFSPASKAMMKRAHDGNFVDAILRCEIRNGHGNLSRAVADSLKWTTGSHYAAAVAALTDGVACSPTSGFHHSLHDDCHGFCTFNGLMISAVSLMRNKYVGSVGIADYDNHYGDGTQDIIDVLGLHDTVSQVNACGYFAEDADGFLRDIPSQLESLNADIIFYQAGADLHVNDPLGGLLNTEQMRERDRIVFEYCRVNEIPVVWNLAGGYQVESDGSIPKVLELHRHTMLEAIASVTESVA